MCELLEVRRFSLVSLAMCVRARARSFSSISAMKFMNLPWILVLVEMKFRYHIFDGIFIFVIIFFSLANFLLLLVFVFVANQNFPMFGSLFCFCIKSVVVVSVVGVVVVIIIIFLLVFVCTSLVLCSSSRRAFEKIIWCTNINSAQGKSSRLYFQTEELVRNCQSFTQNLLPEKRYLTVWRIQWRKTSMKLPTKFHIYIHTNIIYAV